MEHLPQHHQRDSGKVTSFSSALSLLPPAMSQRSQGRTPELQTSAPCAPGTRGRDVLGRPQVWLRSPPCAPLTPACPAPRRAVQPWQRGCSGRCSLPALGRRQSQHRASETRTCQGIMPIHRQLTPRKSSAPRPYLPLPHPLALPPPPPRLMGFLDVETSCIGTLGCAWEP